jgi:hypothetical protein
MQVHITFILNRVNFQVEQYRPNPSSVNSEICYFYVGHI